MMKRRFPMETFFLNLYWCHWCTFYYLAVYDFSSKNVIGEIILINWNIISIDFNGLLMSYLICLSAFTDYVET